MSHVRTHTRSASQPALQSPQDTDGSPSTATSTTAKAARKPSSRSGDIASLFSHDIVLTEPAKPRSKAGVKLSRSQSEAPAPSSRNSSSRTVITTTATFTGAATTASSRMPKMEALAEGPEIRPFSEWDANTYLNGDDKAVKQASALDVNDAEQIVKRASLLTQLLMALDEGNTSSILENLKEIPASVQRFDLYFPPAPISPPAPVELQYQQLVTLATQFDSDHRTLSTLQFLMLLTDCADRLETQYQFTSHFETVPDAQIDQKFSPQVQDLCFALRDIHEFELIKEIPETEDGEEANPAKDITALILKAMLMEDRDLVTELATQPFANLRMLQTKCTVLAVIDEGQSDLVIAFRKKVELARELQMNASALLREQLLRQPVDKEKVAALALIEHAKQTTTLPIDYVSAGASWDDVHTLHDSIREVYTYYVEDLAGDFRVEQAALEWVYKQIRSSTQLSQ